MANRTYLFAVDRLPETHEDRPDAITPLAGCPYALPGEFLALVSANTRSVASLSVKGTAESGPVRALAGDWEGGIDAMMALCQSYDRRFSRDRLLPGAEAARAWLAPHEQPYLYLEHFEIDEMNHDGTGDFFLRENAAWMRATERLAAGLASGTVFDASIEGDEDAHLARALSMMDAVLPVLGPDGHDGAFATAQFLAPRNRAETDAFETVETARKAIAGMMCAARPGHPRRWLDRLLGRPPVDAWSVTIHIASGVARRRAFAGDALVHDEPLPPDHPVPKAIRGIAPAHALLDGRPLLAANAVCRIDPENGGMHHALFTEDRIHCRWETPLDDPAEHRAYLIENRGAPREGRMLRDRVQALRDPLAALARTVEADAVVVATARERGEPSVVLAFRSDGERLVHRAPLPADHPLCIALRDDLAPLNEKLSGRRAAALALTLSPHHRDPERYPPRVSFDVAAHDPRYWADLPADGECYDRAFFPPGREDA